MKVSVQRIGDDAQGRRCWEASCRGRRRHRYVVWQGVKDDPDQFVHGRFYALRRLEGEWRQGWGELEAATLRELRERIAAHAAEFEEVHRV